MGLIVSCVASCLATCGCAACSKACGDTKKGNKAFYVLLLFGMIIVALTLRYWGGNIVVPLYIYTYDYQIPCLDRCIGYAAVYRISAALFFFYMIHCGMLLCRGCGRTMNEANFVIQLLIFIVVLIGCWCIPSQFYDGYVEVARVVSGVFLILQIALFIDFAIKWNEDWISPEKDWKTGIIVVSLFFYFASLAAFILGILYFGGSSCGLHNFFIVFTLMFTFVFSVFTMTEANQSQGSFLSSAIVCIYMYYLLFTSMMSDPNLSCNPFNSSNDIIQIVLGLLLSAMSISYAGYSMATSGSLWGPTEEGDNAESLSPPADVESGDKEKDAAAKAEAAQAAKDKKADDKEASASEQRVADVMEDKRNAKFHFFMAATAMYMAMLLTSWGSLESGDANDGDLNKTSMWIKIVTQWICGLLYSWSLLAPTLFPDREF